MHSRYECGNKNNLSTQSYEDAIRLQASTSGKSTRDEESTEYFEKPECKKENTEKIDTLAEELTVQNKFRKSLMEDKHSLLIKQNENMQEMIDGHKADKNELLKRHKEELNNLESRQDKERQDLGSANKGEEKKISMRIDECESKLSSIREEMRIQFQSGL